LRKIYSLFYKDSADLPVQKTIKFSGSTVCSDTAAKTLRRRRKNDLSYSPLLTPLLQNGSINPEKSPKIFN